MSQVRKTTDTTTRGEKKRDRSQARKKQPIRRQAQKNKKPKPSAGKQRNRSQARENQDDVAKCGKTRQPKPSEGKEDNRSQARKIRQPLKAQEKQKNRNKERVNRKFEQMVGKRVVFKNMKSNLLYNREHKQQTPRAAWCTCDH